MKKYIVTLTDDERRHLEQLLAKGKAAARTLRHAQALLKADQPAGWKDGNFTDGQVNNLALFKPENNVNSVAYVYREIDCPQSVEMPISLGSDDTLTVWLNGQKLLAENVYRAAGPDQSHLVLKLKKGKNTVLLKINNGGGPYGFYFTVLAEQELKPVDSK